MKNHIQKFLLYGIGLFLMAACEKDVELTTLESVEFPTSPELSSNSVLLLQEEENQPALMVSWPEVIYPIDAPVEYTVQITTSTDTVGENGWMNAISYVAGKDVYSKSFKGIELNKIAEELGLEAEVAGNLVVRVLSYMDRTIASDPVGLSVTPYKTVITLTEIYLPGAYQEWDPSTANSISTTGVSGVFQGYLTLPEGGLDFKITLARNWDDNYGDDDNGNLVFDSPNNLSVPAPGTYRITVNLNTMRWTAELYSFGIIGTATSGGWNEDTDMTFDNVTKSWKISEYLVPGALKFRLNDSWNVNYGPRNNDEGIAYLDDPGAHTIPVAGMYEVTFRVDAGDSSIAHYTVTPISWGIIGDATAGGWDADTDMTYDPAAGVWTITSDLSPGALKFRRNDSWAVNYGPRNNEDGILYLDDPGAHGIAEAGRYNITLDLNTGDPETARYTIEKVQ